MDIKTLEKRLADSEEQFKNLQITNNKLQEQMTGNNEEALKLAGEYRAINKLIDQLKAKEKKNG